MIRQRDIEIYVSGCAREQLLAWLNERVGPLDDGTAEGDAVIYASADGPVIVTPGVEGGPFTSVWVNHARTPWDTDAACAREAARALKCVVRCDPGGQEADHANVFLEIVGMDEQLVVWG